MDSNQFNGRAFGRHHRISHSSKCFCCYYFKTDLCL